MEEGDEPLFRHGGVFGLVPERIQVEDRDHSERVVVTFSRIEEASSSGDIELWVEPTADPRVDGSGEPISMDGQYVLSISIPGASPRLDGPLPDIIVPEGGVVQDVEYSGFEGGGSLYIGLNSTDTEYRLQSSNDPYQVVVDIRLTDPTDG